MNKIDLTKILKNCPKGTKLYSTIYGNVKFVRINDYSPYPIIIENAGGVFSVTRRGMPIIDYEDSVECTIFPSKDQHDWSKFTAPWYKKERFDPKTLKPFDKVLARCSDFKWVCDIFSHYDKLKCVMPYVCVGGLYEVCIPYNDETKHLVGTTEEAPEFYRYWEDWIMTPENKELLIKDLCARLPYDVIVDYAHNTFDVRNGYYIKHDSKCILTCNLLDVFMSPRQNEEEEYIKPYLFPLSSITEEQQINLTKFVANGIHGENILYDWYNKNHFDYRGLIEKGLAFDATGLNIY